MKKYVFADESGCFNFSRGPNISRFFILCSVSLDPGPITSDIMQLRRDLAWEGYRDNDCIHATSDPQPVRDSVFEVIQKHDFRIDATILEKSKAQPHIRPSDVRFYQHAWFYHFKYVAPRVFKTGDEAFVCAASIGAKKKAAAFRTAVNDTVGQSVSGVEWRTAFWPANSEPGLLVADYCCWAIQRKWERADARSYSLIENKIATEFDLWRLGAKHFF